MKKAQSWHLHFPLPQIILQWGNHIREIALELDSIRDEFPSLYIIQMPIGIFASSVIEWWNRRKGDSSSLSMFWSERSGIFSHNSHSLTTIFTKQYLSEGYPQYKVITFKFVSVSIKWDSVYPVYAQNIGTWKKCAMNLTSGLFVRESLAKG